MVLDLSSFPHNLTVACIDLQIQWLHASEVKPDSEFRCDRL